MRISMRSDAQILTPLRLVVHVSSSLMSPDIKLYISIK